MMGRKMIAFLIMTTFPLQATLFHEIDTTNLLKSTLSSSHHNRIAIDGGRIKKVIFSEAEVVIRMEEESGQIFVQTLTRNPPDTTISIVTDEGEVQDIELSFVEKSSETLILRYPRDWDTHSDCCDPAEEIVDVVDSILNGRTPSGYFSYPGTNECRRVSRGVRAVNISILAGPQETLYVWQLENRFYGKKRLNEREVNFYCGSWVYLDRYLLKPGEQTIAIISVKKS